MGLARLVQWACKGTGKRRPRPVRRPFGRTILRLELLEDRVTPSAVSWTGGGDGTSWTDAQNWSTKATPGASDDVTINSTFATVRQTGTVTVQSLSVLGGTLDNSGSLTTSAGLTLGGSFDTITNTGTLTVNGPFTWTNGTLNGAGDTVLNGSSSLSGGFFSMLTNQTIDNHGTATIADGNSIDFSGNAVWNNDAGSTFDLQGSGSLGNFFASSASAFNNQGTFQKSGPASTATVGIAFNTTGTVDVQTGTLNLNAGGTGSGTFTIESGASLSTGNYTLSEATLTGNLQVTGGTLTVAGASTVQNLTVTGGTVLVNAPLTVEQQLIASGGTVNANTGSVTAQDLSLAGGFFGGPTLTGSGTITVNGAFDWTGGTLTGSGDTVLNGTTTFDVASSFFSPLSRRVDNYGTATVTAGTSLTFESNASFNNEAGGTLNLPDSVSLGNFFSGGSQLNNAGLVQKTAPAGNASIGIAFNNTGTVDVQAGTLTLSGGGTNSGIITVESGATLNVSNNYTLQEGSETGAGTFQVSGGTLTVAAPTNLQNLTVTGGTVLANAALGVQDLTASGGTVNANTGSVTAQNLSLAGGFFGGPTLTGSGTITVNGAFDWTGGTLTGSGDTVLNGTSTFDVASSFFSPLSRRVDNYGTATVTAGTSLTFESNAAFNNEAGGTLNLPDSVSLGNFFSTSQLNNAGLVQKTAPAGNASIGIAFNNTGTVDVQAGTLTLSGGGSSSGGITVESGATLNVSSNYTLQGGNITGAGAFQVSGGTLTVAAPTSLQNLLVTGGTVLANAALGVQDLTASGGTVNANTGDVTAQNLSLAGGFFGGPTLTGSGTITVNGAFDWTGGTLTGSGDTVLNGTSTFDVASSFFSPLSRQVDNYGTATVTAGTSLTFENNAVFNNEAGGTLVLPDSVSLGNFFSGGSLLNNAGLIQKVGPANTATIGVTVDNTGTIEVDAGTLSLSGLTNFSGTTLTGGTYILRGVLQIPNADIHTNDATIVLDGPAAELFNSGFFSQNDALTNLAANASGGSLTIEDGRNLTTPGAFSNAGAITVGTGSTFTAKGDYTQASGSTVVNGTLTANTTATIDAGSLSGSGTVNADVVNAGTVMPGDAPAVLTINGSYTQTPAGTLAIQIGGTTPGSGYSQLAVSGAATLAGSLDVSAINNYIPNPGDTFQVLTFASHTGDFTTYNGLNLGNGRVLQPQNVPGDTGLDLVTYVTTTTSGSVSSATPYFGQPVTFTANVTYPLPNPVPPVGSVDFFDLTTNTDLGTGTLDNNGVATLTTSAPLPDGTQTIVVSYLGSTGFRASMTTVTVTVRPSVYVLDATADRALSLTGGASVNVPGLVQVDSSSSSALTEDGTAQMTAAAIQVVGGDSIHGGAGFSTTPVTNAAAVADPLAGLPVPPSGLSFQGAVNLSGSSSLTINPGVYTQIQVSDSASLTLTPGVYVIAGGGLSVTVTGTASVTGSGVLIYNAGSNYLGSGNSFGGITITESGRINLTAATSGPYAGIAIFQARDNTQGISVSGSGVLQLNDGVLYAPAAQVTLNGSGALQGASLVVDQLHLTGQATYAATTEATPPDAAVVTLADYLASVLPGGSGSPGGSLPLANINSAAFQTALQAVFAEWRQGGPAATQALDSLLAIVNAVTGLTKDPSQYA